jgi:hypothetical protein
MKDLLDKLTSYNIFNYLFPGFLFGLLSKEVTGYNFLLHDVISGAFLYYFIGLVISRIGSLVIEPILRKVKFVVFSSYSDFIDASKKDDKIELLNESNNMYRTIISLLMSLAALRLYNYLETSILFLKPLRWVTILLILMPLFLYSYRKQTKYIFDRVKRITEKENKE